MRYKVKQNLNLELGSIYDIQWNKIIEEMEVGVK